MLILANWAAQASRDDRERLRWKLDLMRRCIREGFRGEQIAELYRFMDWVLELPEELEQEFEREIRRDEGLMTPYVTTWERKGIAMGRARLMTRPKFRGFRGGF